ncbi:SMC-Scp complex subunit ScpB [Candidatus Pacearchaeota archaeon]|nr:SMC-Scp complex subunit ScpB [Candidatus Pacearchaeota archaeon]
MNPENTTQKSVEELDLEIETENLKKVEAALFISGRFLKMPELIALTDVSPILLRKILSDLEDKYKESGIKIIEKNNAWKMDVDENFTWLVNKFASGKSEFTKAEQETLAVIAYKQPIKQSVIINVRGNKAYDHIRMFVEMGLINKKKTGHTAELTINDKFYDYFHTEDTEDKTELIAQSQEAENLEDYKGDKTK